MKRVFRGKMCLWAAIPSDGKSFLKLLLKVIPQNWKKPPHVCSPFMWNNSSLEKVTLCRGFKRRSFTEKAEGSGDASRTEVRKTTESQDVWCWSPAAPKLRTDHLSSQIILMRRKLQWYRLEHTLSVPPPPTPLTWNPTVSTDRSHDRSDTPIWNICSERNNLGKDS